MRLVARNGIKKLATRSGRLSSGASSREGLELSLVRTFESARGVEGENATRRYHGEARGNEEKHETGTKCVRCQVDRCILSSIRDARDTVIFSIRITTDDSVFSHCLTNVMEQCKRRKTYRRCYTYFLEFFWRIKFFLNRYFLNENFRGIFFVKWH